MRNSVRFLVCIAQDFTSFYIVATLLPCMKKIHQICVSRKFCLHFRILLLCYSYLLSARVRVTTETMFVLKVVCIEVKLGTVFSVIERYQCCVAHLEPLVLEKP